MGKVFSKIDAKNEYNQIDMTKRYKKKTALSRKLGTFEHSKMPFGLKNIPVTS